MKNKLKYLLIICISAIYNTSVSQNFEGGIQAGANLSQVDGDLNGGYNKIGMNGGVFVRYQLPNSPKSKVGFDLSYMNKGSQNKRDEQNLNPIIIYNYHYVSVPIYYMFQVKENLALRSGLSWGYVFGSSLDDGGSEKEITGLRNTDIGFHLGVEYAFNEKLSALVNYQYSIRSIIDQDRSLINVPFAQFRRNGVYHNLFQVSLSYRLTKQ